MIVFKLDKRQEDEAVEFMFNHGCTMEDLGAIGGAITYQFTMTNIGLVEKVVCACGEEKDLTDYSGW